MPGTRWCRRRRADRSKVAVGAFEARRRNCCWQNEAQQGDRRNFAERCGHVHTRRGGRQNGRLGASDNKGQRPDGHSLTFAVAVVSWKSILFHE